MKLLVRSGFLALIVLGCAIQLTRGRRGDADSDPMATLAAGLERLNVRTDGSASADMLTGHLPSCEQPIHVMLLRIDGAEDERLRDFRPEDEVALYVYLGSVGENRAKALMIGRFIWARVAFTVGLRSARPPANLVAVVLPRACPELATLEWTALSPRD